MAKYTTLNGLFAAIANALRGKTGGTEKIVADDFPSVIDSLSTGGITPTGTKTITTNGTHDVTNYASALVNVAGLNIRIFTSTVAADATSGSPTISPANDFIASIRSDPNAFVCVRYLGAKASTAMLTFWFNANFPIAYRAATKYNCISVRQTASQEATVTNVNGLTGENYSGHICVASDGRIYSYVSETYPLRTGEYQIIAGTLEMQ